MDAARLPDGGVCAVLVDGQALAVCHAQGQFYIVSGVCPHLSGPLGHGALHGHALVCPWHGWEFDCSTGACDFNSTILVAYPARTVDGAVWADLNA